MGNAERRVTYDSDLRLTAYRFEGIAQPFPVHFHDDYVIGLVLRGERRMVCKGREQTIRPGHLILLSPGDSHGCAQCDGGTFDYISLSLPSEIMLDLTEELTARRVLPGFSPNVMESQAAKSVLCGLHAGVMRGCDHLNKEEELLLLLSLLLERCGIALERRIPECREEIERACALMESRFAERIRLDELCRCAGLSRSALLRAFVRCKGVTPYRYLENIRIREAKRLLEQGAPSVAAALRTGFSDQSHFTHAFNRFIGLTPGMYRSIFEAYGEGRHGPQGEYHEKSK